MADEFLTVAEASNKLGVSPRTIQRYCRQGRLNHKWVSGKRHKELRILPPISLDKLPGVKRKTQLNVADYVTRKDFDETASKLERELLKKDIRIDELRQEVTRLKTQLEGAPAQPHGPVPAQEVDGYMQKMLTSLTHELEKVRPAEKRLIIKLAETIREHNQFLKTLGYGGDGENK